MVPISRASKRSMTFRSRKVIQRQNVRPQGGRRELPLNGTKYTSWTLGKLDGAQKHCWYINNNIPPHIWPRHAMRSPPARTCTLPHHEQSRHELAPPPLRAYILPLNDFSGSEHHRPFRAGSDRGGPPGSVEPLNGR